MDNKHIIDLIKNYLNKINMEFLEIYLFGSRGRGDFEVDSDYDILIVLKNNLTSQARRKLSVEIKKYLILNNILLNIDLIIKNYDSWVWESENLGFLSYTVKREGIIL